MIGAIADRLGGRVFVAMGKSIGEISGGQLRRDISASESTIVEVLGHGRLGG